LYLPDNNGLLGGGVSGFQHFLASFSSFFVVVCCLILLHFVLLLFPALAASLSLSLILASFDYNDRPARPPARLLDNEAIFFVVENEFSTALSCGLSRNASLFLFFFSSSFPYVRTDSRRSAGVSLVVLGLLRSLVIPAQLRQTKVEPIKGQGPIVYAA
jgi:hypothetical protein